jgi:hypothetical protein
MTSLRLVHESSKPKYNLDDHQVFTQLYEWYDYSKYFDNIENIALDITNDLEDFYNKNNNTAITTEIDVFLLKCLKAIDPYREEEFTVNKRFFLSIFEEHQKITRKNILKILTSQIY